MRLLVWERELSVPEKVREKYGKLAVVYWRRKKFWGGGEIISPKNFFSSKNYTPLWEGAERFVEWLKSGEKVGIVADYDADGITSASIFWHLLKGIKGKGAFYLPTRSEGYGVSHHSIDALVKAGCRKILVLDSGTGFNSVFDYAVKKGCEVIVIDHHEAKEETRNAFLINPKAHGVEYLRDLCTAGLSFYFAGAVNELLGKPLSLSSLLELACVGTVADVVPLSWANRIIVGLGIRKINSGADNEGIREIMARAGLSAVDEDVIGWVIAPRINAAGRVGDPLVAFYTLTKNPSYADKLERLNRQRQYFTRLIYDEAISMPLEGDVIFLFSPNWNSGVVGIVAGRIARLTGKITFVGNLRNGVVHASGRNPTDANLVDVMKSASSFLDKFGGHAGAGGMSVKVENVEKVVEAMSSYVREKGIKPAPVEVDACIPLSYFDEDKVKLLHRWGPYGEGTPKPLFYDRVEVLKQVGTDRFYKVYVIKDSNGKEKQVRSCVELNKGINGVVFSAHKGLVIEERVDG